MALLRYVDWATRLDKFLTENKDRRFVYGTWDCCLWVCDAVCVMTKIDPAQSFRGTYTNRQDAKLALIAYCGSNSVEAVTEKITDSLDMPEVPLRKAKRGDIVLLPRTRHSWSLGLVSLKGHEIVVCQARGLMPIPILRAHRAWSV
jgi:hypothetical protein